MIDMKKLKTPEAKTNLEKRGYLVPAEVHTLIDRQKQLRLEIEAINARANRNHNVIGDKVFLRAYKEECEDITEELCTILHMMPNFVDDTVPPGRGAADNVIVRMGHQDKFNTNRLTHGEIGKMYGLDIEAGVRLAHTRFNVMRGEVAKLQRRLLNMALDFYGTLGYEECYVPNLVNEAAMFGTGQYPKFKEELFATEGNQKLFLVPTGEVPLTNTVQDKVLLENELPLNLMTHTPCFRKEVGTYGKDTKGIIRQHQFEKVELVKICKAEDGLVEFEKMINDVELFVKQFNIPYRIIELCAGDIGFAGHKAYDFELWFPGEQVYREIATITWCHDFQARRMNTKVKYKDKRKELVHTLNGTGLAVGRVLAAILEHYYTNEQLELPDNFK